MLQLSDSKQGNAKTNQLTRRATRSTRWSWQMADDSVNSLMDNNPEERVIPHEEAVTGNQNISKRQMKKLLKQQKWEEERELRK